jgi:hypothetical protein
MAAIPREHAASAEGTDPTGTVEQDGFDIVLMLASCTDAADADALLDRWLEQRTDVLRQTRARLRREWEVSQHAQQAADADARDPPEAEPMQKRGVPRHVPPEKQTTQ